jgi:hypothetical protein
MMDIQGLATGNWQPGNSLPPFFIKPLVTIGVALTITGFRFL